MDTLQEFAECPPKCIITCPVEVYLLLRKTLVLSGSQRNFFKERVGEEIQHQLADIFSAPENRENIVILYPEK